MVIIKQHSVSCFDKSKAIKKIKYENQKWNPKCKTLLSYQSKEFVLKRAAVAVAATSTVADLTRLYFL